MFPQAVLGYRAWQMEDNSLAPLFQGAAWRPGHNLAYCHSAGHTAPADDCHCGFNAYYQLEDACEWVRHSKRVVIGLIAAKGRLQAHHNGFRAEEAQVLALWLPAASKHDLLNWQGKRLAARYQVPLVSSAELQALASNYQIPAVPVSLRPQAEEDSEIIQPLKQTLTSRLQTNERSSVHNLLIYLFFALACLSALGFLYLSVSDLISNYWALSALAAAVLSVSILKLLEPSEKDDG